MFSFFKKRPHLHSYALLGVDIHSHLLPGIDDGAPTLEDSLRLIRGMVELGYSRLITTPHVNWEYYPNTSAVILDKLAEVRAAIAQENIPVTLEAAAEYYLDDHFERLLEADDLLPLPGNHVLVEMSFFGPPPKLEQYLFRLRTKGYQPILAHPERYLFMQGDMRPFQRLKELGCLFQLNIPSLVGYYDQHVQRQAELLLRKGFIDLLGADLHHERHLLALQDALEHKLLREALEVRKIGNGRITADGL